MCNGMDGTAKVGAIVVICLTVIILCGIFGGNHYSAQKLQVAMENGYEQITIAGHDYPVWQKVDSDGGCVTITDCQ